MAGKYILVHDLGTTGNKAIIVNEKLELMASSYTEWESFYPRPRWAEQDPETWWSAVVTSTKEALATSKIDPADIAVISFSAQMMSATPVDKDGNILIDRTPFWADERSGEQAKRIHDAFGGLDNYYQIHGVGWQTEYHVLCKMMWMKENMPEVYKKTYKFLQAKEVIANRLTGNFATEWGDASMCGYMDIKERKLSDDLFNAAGIDKSKVPDVMESHDIMGYVTAEAAKITGLKEGTPVSVGSGDVICSDVGAGVVKPGMAYTYIGSANWTGVFSETPSTDLSVKMNCSTCLPWPDAYHIVLITTAGGIAQQWNKDNSYCEGEGFDEMTAEAAKMAPCSDGLVFLPYIRGGGAPHFDTNARGAYLGALLQHNRGHFTRALYEGIVFNIRWLYELFESVNVPIFSLDQIRAIGGGVQNDLWLQIYADTNSVPFARVNNPQQVTAVGAAIMGGVGVGIFNSYQEAAELVSIDRVFTPNAEATELYDELYPIYKQAYPTLKKTFEMISAFQAKHMRGDE